MGTIIFLLSGGLILYVIVLYPLLLGWRARRPKTIRKEFILRSVSAVIAVRNGAPWLRQKLESILKLDYPPELLEILVISDGTDEGTDDIARDFKARGVRLLRVPQGGKPAALTAGIPLTRNELLLLTDVRQEIEPDALRHMVACFGDPAVGVVSGELLIRSGETQAEGNVGLYWRYESWIRQCLSNIDSMLGATGPFYMIRRELTQPLDPDCLLDDMFLPLGAFFRGYRCVLEPAARAIDYPTTLETEFRRKVRTLAGNYQIVKYYPGLLGPQNRMWIDFVSYKLGRLALPFALLGAAISAFWLPFWLAVAAVTMQAGVYGLALVDHWIPENSFPKRLTSPARTFVVLVAAALCATAIFVVPPKKLWKPTRTRAAGV